MFFLSQIHHSKSLGTPQCLQSLCKRLQGHTSFESINPLPYQPCITRSVWDQSPVGFHQDCRLIAFTSCPVVKQLWLEVKACVCNLVHSFDIFLIKSRGCKAVRFLLIKRMKQYKDKLNCVVLARKWRLLLELCIIINIELLLQILSDIW